MSPAAPQYPLAAIVGQEDLVQALLVCAVNPSVGGVLVRGERGTAKSTAVRALAPMLAADDDAPGTAGAALVEVPLGATLDRLVGSLDVRAALGGEHRAEAGLLARAHGGVLYVDEVNLLGDHLVDALLDAAAAGRVVVERDGISVESPARFLLVGTMNPEEGELRPQLLDRFGLGVEVAGPRDPRVRAEIVRRRMDFDVDPAAFVARWADKDAAIVERLRAARERLGGVRLSDRMLERVTATCANLDLDGVRGDLVCAQTARALAALDGAPEVAADHVARAAHLALRHRLRRDPLAPPPTGGREPAIDAALDASTGHTGIENGLDANHADEAYDAAHPDHTAEAGGESGPRGGGRADSAGTKDGVGRRGAPEPEDERPSTAPPTSAPSWEPSPDLAPPRDRGSAGDTRTGSPSEQPGGGAPRAVRPIAVPS
ncbi:MAG: ATP-binding protein, partial [Solirubrobacteraceae bacterium]|nr:ATP-binding protein [Solirubrobacteraceae bacterium]